MMLTAKHLLDERMRILYISELYTVQEYNTYFLKFIN